MTPRSDDDEYVIGGGLEVGEASGLTTSFGLLLSLRSPLARGEARIFGVGTPPFRLSSIMSEGTGDCRGRRELPLTLELDERILCDIGLCLPFC